MDNKEVISKNFIERIIDKDLEEGTYTKVATRFPPEPNGYLHIGHAKSILLNYGLAKKYNGTFNLRFDDTNPTKEKTEFVDSIIKDVEWLGAHYDGEVKFASDYFPQMYEAAIKLIKKGKAYVCDLTADQIKEYRGTLTEPGKNSPYRDRSVEENLDLFERMKNGEFEDGSKVLRAKIDMASPNINMRDPIIYRIARMTHHNTGDQWCIYPMYDFAHPIEDAIEHITHSICTLEFEDHRPLYDWVVQELEYPEPPKQIEFAKLYLTNVVTGKRYIKRLVDQGIVDGWDDPRLVTIAALRRRGFTPESLKNFMDLVGVAKSNSSVDYAMLEYCIRDDLKPKAPRVMADPKDYGARANIMWSGMIAHNGTCGVGNEEDWASHFMEHEISALYDVTHGAGLAVIFPAWLTWMASHHVEKVAQYAARVWGVPVSEDLKAMALEGVARLKSFFTSIGMPVNFAQLGVEHPDIELLVEHLHANKGEQVGCYVRLGRKETREIYELAL